MPIISSSKKDKISEQILYHLFSISPNSAFTSEISKEIARDEEFTKVLLTTLESKKAVVLINKNKNGIDYQRRQRWRLSTEAFDIYTKAQTKQNPLENNNLYNLGFLE